MLSTSRRRPFLVVGAVLAGCLVLVGCTNEADPATRPTPTTSTSPTPTAVELRLAVYGDDETVATYQAIADAYTVDHPEVTVELTSTGDASSAAQAALGAIATGEDAPDVFLLDVDHLPAAVEADALQPVNELLEARDIPFGDGIQRTGLTAYAVNDALACMPNDVSPIVAYYNKQLVKPGRLFFDDGERVGPIDRGWSWDAFLLVIDQAADRGGRGTYLAPDLTTLMPFLLSAGGSVVDDDREPTRLELSDADTRDALKLLAEVTRNPRLTLTPAEVAEKSALEWFADGDLGVLFGTRALVPALRQHTSLRFDVAPLPRIDSSVTTAMMNGYCIAKTSDHVEEAADFIAFATHGAGIRIAASSGYIVPSSLDTLHSAEFIQTGQRPRNYSAYAEGARRSVLTPFSTQWLAAAGASGAALQRVLYGRSIDVTSAETPDLDQLLQLTDEASTAIFNPPEPTESPTP